MSTTLIKNAQIVNEGEIREADLYIKDGLIHTIGNNLNLVADQTIEAKGKLLFPGCIDDQVHFREPGFTHKADIASESLAALAGGGVHRTAGSDCRRQPDLVLMSACFGC